MERPEFKIGDSVQLSKLGKETLRATDKGIVIAVGRYKSPIEWDRTKLPQLTRP